MAYEEKEQARKASSQGHLTAEADLGNRSNEHIYSSSPPRQAIGSTELGWLQSASWLH